MSGICLDDELQPINSSHLSTELRRALLNEWCNIPQDQIDNLILSMPRRCKSPSKPYVSDACPHVAGILRAYLDTENIQLLLWLTRSPDLLPIENDWSMVAERLARCHTPVTTVDELWHRFEAA
ncbi:hypothetical protein TNCV_74761 [Trichonephila clavipes]|nr:hypothetical protein TNCV_74761 [Trichonephila clavipes]